MGKQTIALGLLAVLAAGFSARADDAPSPRFEGNPSDLVGDYTVVSGEKFGQKEPEERIKGTTVRFSVDRVVITDAKKQEVYGATYKLDPRPKACRIEMTSKLGNSEGQVAKGLIDLDGETLRLIYALPGGEEPSEFKTKPRQLMFVMKKAGK